MAIKEQFHSALIRHPGAYSQSTTNASGGANTVSSDTILLIGEADAGEGGATAGIVFFSAAAYADLLATYQTGAIVDAAKNCLAPLNLPGSSGPGVIGVYKTNASAKASLALATSYATLNSLTWGVSGNRTLVGIAVTSETLPSVTGSAALTVAGLDTETLIIRTDGGAATTVTFTAPADANAVVSQINAQDTSVTASQVGGVLTITKNAIANHHRDGFGTSIEIVGGTALALLNLTAGQYGIPAAEQQATVTVSSSIGNIKETDVIGGDVPLTIGRDGSSSCTAATVQVTSTSIILTATGSTSYTLAISQYPLLSDLAAAIANIAGGWTVTLGNLYKSYPTTALDQVTVGAYSTNARQPARLKIDAYDFAHAFAASVLVAPTMTAVKGLPDALSPAVNLAGGLRNGSASSDFEAGLTASLSEEVNVIVPLISQDAAADIALGVTDSSSTYDVDAVIAALSSNLDLRASIKNRMEAQGVVGYRTSTKAALFAAAAGVADATIQMVGQDVLVVDASGNLNWKQPHILAAMLGGARLGVDVGEPLTFKYVKVSGIGHDVSPATGKPAGDFNPLIDYDAAIDAGLTFLEPKNGAWRVVVDNTTYGADANFVYNRGSVMQAAQYIARYIRNDLELAFVGQKNTIASAAAIKSRTISRLNELFAAQITAPSVNAPRGYDPDSLLVTLVGNTASVQVNVYPVLGLDFILIDFTLSEAVQSA